MLSLYKIIIQYGKIRRHELLDKADVSISQYNHVKGVFQERYENMVEYNDEQKTWFAPKILIDLEIESKKERTQTKMDDVL